MKFSKWQHNIVKLFVAVLGRIYKFFSPFTDTGVTPTPERTIIETGSQTTNNMRKPELIDLHFNGLKNEVEGINCNFWKCPNDQEILKLRKYLFEHGVKAFLPTLVTASPENIERQLARIAEHRKDHHSTTEAESLAQELAYIPGVHIEGGYISRPGTHPQEYLQALGPNLVEKLAKEFPGLIKLWTICPKVDADGKHVAAQRRHGITPSYGHSTATYEEARKAFDEHGVRLVTHWGNGMDIFQTPYNRDEPSDQELLMLEAKGNENGRGGLAKAAFDRNDVYMMAICGSNEDRDRHISPKLIKKLAQTGRLILVTDAVAEPAGAPSPTGCGGYHKAYGYSLSGGQVTLDKHAANAKNDAGLTEPQIQQATVTNPGKVLANSI